MEKSKTYLWIMAVTLVTLLSACATTSPTPADYNALLQQAETAAEDGRMQNALQKYTQAAAADPTRKMPWVRIAQIRFDKQEYALAILAAEEALHRVPDDSTSNSILTVSGFRLAHQALNKLQENDALVSQVARSEAASLSAALGSILEAGVEETDQAESEPEADAAETANQSQPDQTEEDSREENPDPFQQIGGF